MRSLDCRKGKMVQVRAAWGLSEALKKRAELMVGCKVPGRLQCLVWWALHHTGSYLLYTQLVPVLSWAVSQSKGQSPECDCQEELIIRRTTKALLLDMRANQKPLGHTDLTLQTLPSVATGP